MDTTQPTAPSTDPKSVGPAVGVIIILLLVIVGGLYFWGERQNELKNIAPPATEEQTDTQTASTSADMTASTSAEIQVPIQ